MRKLKLTSAFLLSFLFFVGFTIKAQDGSDCSQSINIKDRVNLGASNLSFTETVGTTDNLWYKFTAEKIDGSITVTNVGLYINRINRVSLYSGCIGTIIPIAEDNITNQDDNVLTINFNNLIIGNDYYVLVGGDNKVVCECPASNQITYVMDVADVLACSNYDYANFVKCTNCLPEYYNSDACQLVCNGSFEYNSGSAANGMGNIAAACGWQSGGGSPDYFYAGGPSPMGGSCLTVGQPCNGFGYQSPHTGFGYTGISNIYGYSPVPPGYNHEYLMTDLRQSLVAGQAYSISLWISRSDHSTANSNNIQIAFFDNSFFPSSAHENTLSAGWLLSAPTTSIVTLSGNITTSGWLNLTGSYTPSVSGQVKMLIGYFNSYTNTYVGCGSATSGCFSSCGDIVNSTTDDHANYMFIDDVSLSPIPNTSFIASPTSICVGNNVNYTATGGTNYTFTPTITPTFTPPTTYPILYTYTGVASPLTTTTYSLATEIGGLSGCIINSQQTITVNPNSPTLTVNNPTSCVAGGCVTLNVSANPPQSLTYNWSTGQTGSSISVCPTSTSTYTVSAFIASAGCSSTATAVVNVNPVNLTVNSIGICSGQTANLLATSTTTGVTYSWSNGQTGSTISVTPTVTTTYTVTATAPNGCVAVAVATVTVNNPPNVLNGFSISPNPVCLGKPVTFTAFQAQSNNQYTYIFNYGDPASPGTISGTSPGFSHAYSTSGTHYPSMQILIAGNPCPSQLIYGTLGVNTITSFINAEAVCNVGHFSTSLSNNACFDPNYTYTWNFGDGSSPLISQGVTTVNHEYPAMASSVTYTISLTVTNSLGIVVSSATTTLLNPATSASVLCCDNEIASTDGQGRQQIVVPTGGSWTPSTFPIVDKHFVVKSGAKIDIPLSLASQDVIFSNCTFTFYENSSFEIHSNLNARYVQLNNCHLHGCTKMWKGIHFYQPYSSNIDGTNLFIINTLIEDAYIAVDETSVDKAGIYINSENSIFNKNYKDIYAFNSGSNSRVRVLKSSFTCRNLAFTVPIPTYNTSPSSFYTSQIVNKIMIPTLPMPGIAVNGFGNSFTGITIQSSGYGVVDGNNGNNIELVDYNIYDNHNKGILLLQQSDAIEKQYFYNIKNPNNYTGYDAAVTAAIMCVGNTSSGSTGSNSPITNVGGNNTAKANIFNNCYRGVLLHSDQFATVRRNTFTNKCNYGTVARQMNINTSTQNCAVQYNTFTDIQKTAMYFENNTSINAMATGNVVNFSSVANRNYTSKGAEVIEANSSLTGAKYAISTNNMDYVFIGIRLENTNNTQVNGNTIRLNTKLNTNGLTVNNAPYNLAVHAINSYAPQVYKNTITGAGASYSWWEQGIVEVDCPNAQTYCNKINSTWAGLTTGGSSLGTKMYHNDISNVQLAHWLIFANIIGDQFDPNLTIGGSIQPVDNRYYNVAQHSYTQNGTNGQSNARFFIRGDNLAAPYALLNNGWETGTSTPIATPLITNSVSPFSPNACSSGPFRLISLADKVATDQLYSPITESRYRFVSRKQLLTNMWLEDITNSGDSDIDNFPTITTNEASGKFKTTDKLIAEFVETNNNILLSQAAGINQGVNDPDEFVVTQKKFNNSYITYLQNGQELNPIDIANLQQVAALCPYTHGTAVWQARALLRNVEDIEYFNTCELSGEPILSMSNVRLANISIVEEDERSEINLYPNPASGNFTVEIPNREGKMQVDVYNTLGSKVVSYEKELKADDKSLLIEGLDEGLYVVKISINSTPIANKKVIITK